MFDKNQLTKKLNAAFGRLAKKGVRSEDIAVQLNVSYSSVKAWVAGRRYPKISTVKLIEQLYGVKIL